MFLKETSFGRHKKLASNFEFLKPFTYYIVYWNAIDPTTKYPCLAIAANVETDYNVIGMFLSWLGTFKRTTM